MNIFKLLTPTLILCFNVAFSQFPYIVTDEDVLINDGEIVNYYGPDGANEIIIPPFLQGQ